MRYFLFIGSIVLFSFSCLAYAFEYPYNSKRDRDPMDSLVNEMGKILIKEKGDFTGLSLQGILYSKNGSEVVINGEIYKQGDLIEGHSIKKIEEYKVLLEKDGKEFILKWEG